jgi:hypothetical protein
MARTVCGYKVTSNESNVYQNIKKIRFVDNVKTVSVENFETECVALPSAYNQITIRSIVTPTNNGGVKLIANMIFGEHRIQFIAVDGANLTQYENPDTVIDKVNRGELSPITLSNLGTLSFDDKTKIDAYAGSIWYSLFLWEVFGRVGIIDESHVFLSVVNVGMANAFWNSHYMTYGNGSEGISLPPSMNPLTSLDVIGHESTHGVIEALGNLEYQGESGALNESIADIFGTCLEKYYDIRSNTKLFDWDLGEDFMRGAMRSLNNPNKHRQPDTYKGTYWHDPNSDYDYGGVHINSGVNNFLFWCLVNGGSGKNDHGIDFNITQPVEMFEAAKLLYNSLKGTRLKGTKGYQKIPPKSTYQEYATILLNNCHDQQIRTSVEQALVAVDIDPVSVESTTTRHVVLEIDFTSHTFDPIVAYGHVFKCEHGINVSMGSWLMGAFDLSRLTNPQLHLQVSNNSSDLLVIIDGHDNYSQILFSKERDPSDKTNITLDVPNLSYVKIILLPQLGRDWLSDATLFKHFSLSSDLGISQTSS